MRPSSASLALLLSLLAAPASARFGAPSAPAARAATPGSAGPRAAAASALGDLTSSALWPLPVSDSRASGNAWSAVGTINQAAVGPDCPYSGHGPDASLAACQAGCVSAGASTCTDINWNPSINDCVYRRCVDPAHPTLSPATGYEVFALKRAPVVAFGIDAAAFTFTVANGGFSDAVLTGALARAAAFVFPFGAGSASTLPGPRVPGLEVYVSTSDDLLRLGVDESYKIVVAPSGAAAVLSAPTVFGALRGLETFAQLVIFNISSGSYEIEASTIVDAPRFPYRGIMVDTSRHFISVSVLKQLVDQMAAVKLNTLSIHFNDDQSWPLFIASYPNLSGAGAYSNASHTYSPAAMRDLVAFAKTRGVRILPEFDSPSHFGTLSSSYPQFAAVQSDGGLCMIDPSREESFQFLASVWKDIADMFPDAQFRIGGDEFQGCWSSCPGVMAWVNATFGAKGSIYDAYHYYIRRLIGILRDNGKQTMAWLDVAGFPAPNETWAANYSDVTLNVWTGCYSGHWEDDVSAFTRQNGSVVVSGAYYITSNQPGAPHFTWQQMYQTDLGNFTGNTTDALSHVKGGELCVWDDAAGTDSGDLFMQVTPFLIGVAESWWSPQKDTSGVSPDEGRAHMHRCRLVQRGFASHPIFAFGTYCPREFEIAAYL